MTKKAALGVPSSQPHVNSPRLDKEDLSDDEDALAFRKPILGWYGVAVVSLLLAAFAVLLCIVVDVTITADWVRRWFTSDNTFLRPIIISFVGAVAVLLPVPLTHFLAGQRRHGSKGFRIWQPFRGGSQFVVLQAMAWAIYSLSVIVVGYCLYLGVSKVTPSSGLISSAGAGSIVSQLLVFASLKYFDSQSKRVTLCAPRKPGLRVFGGLAIPNVSEMLKDLQSFFVTALLFLIPVEVLIMFLLPFWMQGLMGGLYLGLSLLGYMLVACRGKPHKDGSRSWSGIRENQFVWASMERYFSGTILPEGKLNPKQPYIFGFHPHGIHPGTVLWATRGPQWRKHYKDVQVDLLAATIVFYVPVLRDFVLWAGARDVSEQSISHALTHQRSVLLLPGGQREMAYSKSEDPNITLVTKHKGFVRLAFRHGVPLVPMFSFGEHTILDNVRAPRMQAFFRKIISFGFPHFPYGRWYTPIPRPNPLNIVVGEPIPVPKVDVPTSQQVDEVHKKYFEALHQLFERNKERCGYGDCSLVYADR